MFIQIVLGIAILEGMCRLLRKLLTLPHRVCESTCYVNGLEDIFAWKGAEYSDFLLSVIGGMAGFTYLRFKSADPPCMVYWGASPRYLMKDLANIIGFKETIMEGKTFKNTFLRLKEFIDKGQPVMAGALDMYYLPTIQPFMKNNTYQSIMCWWLDTMMKNELSSSKTAATKGYSRYHTKNLKNV